MSAPPLYWINIDNPPQVQYLAPIAAALRSRRAEVVITARAHGITHELLAERELEFRPVSSHGGTSKLGKGVAVGRRATRLTAMFARRRPVAAVSASRSTALASWLLRIPSFVLVDYEFVDLSVFRMSGSRILHPRILGPALVERGIRPKSLVPFDGVKEDVTFAGVDPASSPPYRNEALDGVDTDVVRVLVRPPDDRSHYYKEQSTGMTDALLADLAARPEILVLFSPRYPAQVAGLGAFDWSREPIVLAEAIPFLSLLSAVDAVVTGGGTMAREAAYLGIPAVSVFQGPVGAVDRHLADLGRLSIVRDARDLASISYSRRTGIHPLGENTDALGDIVASIVNGSRRP